MPNHASPIKRARRDAKKRLANKSAISTLRTLIKKAKANPADAQAVRAAQKALAIAASKGIIHRNAAARRTSRMMQCVDKQNQEALATSAA